MLRHILSDDYPKSRILAAVLLAILIGLIFAPFLFPGAAALNTAAKICVFIVLVASYDLLLGYTGIVSFAHTMFYGIGSYGVGLSLYFVAPSWAMIAFGLAVALILAAVLAVVIGLLSLRVKAIFFAMITLAVATAVGLLVTQFSEWTGGEDGKTYRVPEALRPGFRLMEEPLFGVTVNGRILTYYIVCLSALALFLLTLRIVNAPFGRVLQAIRENDKRAEALGYRVVLYRTSANVLAACLAAAAGALNALWLRYVGPDASLSFAIMLDLLLMVVIGGMGTLYGAVIGATLFIVAQNYLQRLMGLASEATAGIPLLPNLLHPDRWLLFLGVLFVLSVYFFPQGIVGRLRQRRRGGG